MSISADMSKLADMVSWDAVSAFSVITSCRLRLWTTQGISRR